MNVTRPFPGYWKSRWSLAPYSFSGLLQQWNQLSTFFMEGESPHIKCSNSFSDHPKGNPWNHLALITTGLSIHESHSIVLSSTNKKQFSISHLSNSCGYLPLLSDIVQKKRQNHPLPSFCLKAIWLQFFPASMWGSTFLSICMLELTESFGEPDRAGGHVPYCLSLARFKSEIRLSASPLKELVITSSAPRVMVATQ